jgi:flagellar transcriptional activator FlhC|uniref:flagellar transcriptional regulator FlhC n=1 Tax=Polynucleobacter sp. TaxID=2029855 RepID=UPI0040476DF9
MKVKSIVDESEQLQLAIRLINLGARLQLLEAQTSLSRERLTKLYKELKGISPPKGMLPFSTDWFLTWQPNIHSSLFINIYSFLKTNTSASGIELLIKSYELYLEQHHSIDQTNDHPVNDEPVLSLIRAWTLVRFVDQKLLRTQTCTCCSGNFVVDVYDLHQDYKCSLCHIPSRAGKYQKNKKIVELAGAKKSRSKIAPDLRAAA